MNDNFCVLKMCIALFFIITCEGPRFVGADLTDPRNRKASYTENFSYGGLDNNPKVDYLFVVDNSSSMNEILDNVREGIDSLEAKPEVFSKDSRIGVMSTMIGQLKSEGGDLNKLSSFLRSYRGMDSEPGFLSLVDSTSHTKYMGEIDEKYKAKWYLPPCQNKWFKPGENHPNGHSCFKAATQNSEYPLYVEAGIKAFEQFLEKNSGSNIFRQNSIVNVIFISDTHDPGFKLDPEYPVTRLTYKRFLEKAKGNSSILDLKFHAIAPFNNSAKCSTEGLHEESYFQLVEESGGEKGDVCKLNDYSEIIEKMVVKGKIAQPLFTLKEPVKKITSVLVNNREIYNYDFKPELNSIFIPSLEAEEKVSIAVVYQGN